jgi:hypothetical protein
VADGRWRWVLSPGSCSRRRSERIPIFPGGEALLLGGDSCCGGGLAGDRWGLSVRLRFGLYLVAAGLFAVGAGFLDELQWPPGFLLQLGWLGLPVALLWVVGLTTNAYNFVTRALIESLHRIVPEFSPIYEAKID